MLTRIAIIVAGAVFVLWAVAFILLHTVFHLYRIPTGGMEPAIHIGDHVITERIQDIRRDDIITFDYPLEPKTAFMQRVIGLPGETIRIQSKRVFINGQELSEPYAIHVDEQVYPENPALPEPIAHATTSARTKSPQTPTSRWATTATDRRTRGTGARYRAP